MGSKKGIARGKYKIKKNDHVSCDKCGKKMKRKTTLLQHMRSSHLNYVVKCPVCPKSYASVSVCNRHLKDVHNVISKSLKLRAKPNKTFATSKSLHLKSNPKNQKTLSFAPHESFPDMAKVIAFKENKIFGKHIVANHDIDVGKIVMVTGAFASINFILSDKSRCFECGKPENGNAFQCLHCIDILFCSERCSLSKMHRSKCNQIFIRSDCKNIRLVTETIKIALEAAEDPQALLEFSRGVLFADKKSENCRPQYSRYGVILKLKGKTKREHIQMARRVCKIIVTLPKFKSLYSEEFKRTVFYLACRHLSTIQLNAFTEEFSCKKGKLYLYSLYDILSRFNHSCKPNIRHIIHSDNIIRCEVIRPIKNGDQVN